MQKAGFLKTPLKPHIFNELPPQSTSYHYCFISYAPMVAGTSISVPCRHCLWQSFLPPIVLKDWTGNVGQWQNTCLVCTRPWFWTPAKPKIPLIFWFFVCVPFCTQSQIAQLPHFACADALEMELSTSLLDSERYLLNLGNVYFETCGLVELDSSYIIFLFPNHKNKTL